MAIDKVIHFGGVREYPAAERHLFVFVLETSLKRRRMKLTSTPTYKKRNIDIIPIRVQ
jgi:hypothetical protein